MEIERGKDWYACALNSMNRKIQSIRKHKVSLKINYLLHMHNAKSLVK